VQFIDLIQSRRSVRGYSAPIPHEDLVTLLTRAQQAPSWKNLQASRCYVVESPEVLKTLRREGLPTFNQNSSNGATLVVTTYVRDVVGFTQGQPDNEVGNGWGAYDLGLHDAYLVLAAADMGYDTLIMGIRDAEVIRRLLNIPENEAIMSVIAIGKREKAPASRPRKALDEVTRFV
jgi:nitroreductase